MADEPHSMNESWARSKPYDGGNLFLDALPAAERAALGELRVIEIEAPEAIFARGGEIETVYFPIDTLFSITAELRRRGTTDVYEVGVVGREGLVGVEVALGGSTSRRSVLIQVGGLSALLPATALRERARASDILAGAIHAYTLRRIYAAEQLVGCAFAHTLTQRCARWMLTVRDKVGRSDFGLRREFLAMMLAVEPGQVDAVAAELQATHAIRYDARETVTIVHPRRLLELACECYELLREHGDVRNDGTLAQIGSAQLSDGANAPRPAP